MVAGRAWLDKSELFFFCSLSLTLTSQLRGVGYILSCGRWLPPKVQEKWSQDAWVIGLYYSDRLPKRKRKYLSFSGSEVSRWTLDHLGSHILFDAWTSLWSGGRIFWLARPRSHGDGEGPSLEPHRKGRNISPSQGVGAMNTYLLWSQTC